MTPADPSASPPSASPPKSAPWTARVAGWSARHRWPVFGLWFVVINIPLSLLMIWGAEKLVVWLKARPRVMRGIDFTFAGVFAFFALKVALTQGK